MPKAHHLHRENKPFSLTIILYFYKSKIRCSKLSLLVGINKIGTSNNRGEMGIDSMKKFHLLLKTSIISRVFDFFEINISEKIQFPKALGISMPLSPVTIA